MKYFRWRNTPYCRKLVLTHWRSRSDSLHFLKITYRIFKAKLANLAGNMKYAYTLTKTGPGGKVGVAMRLLSVNVNHKYRKPICITVTFPQTHELLLIIITVPVYTHKLSSHTLATKIKISIRLQRGNAIKCHIPAAKFQSNSYGWRQVS